MLRRTAQGGLRRPSGARQRRRRPCHVRFSDAACCCSSRRARRRSGAASAAVECDGQLLGDGLEGFHARLGTIPARSSPLQLRRQVGQLAPERLGAALQPVARPVAGFPLPVLRLGHVRSVLPCSVATRVERGGSPRQRLVHCRRSVRIHASARSVQVPLTDARPVALAFAARSWRARAHGLRVSHPCRAEREPRATCPARDGSAGAWYEAFTSRQTPFMSGREPVLGTKSCTGAWRAAPRRTLPACPIHSAPGTHRRHRPRGDRGRERQRRRACRPRPGRPSRRPAPPGSRAVTISGSSTGSPSRPPSRSCSTSAPGCRHHGRRSGTGDGFALSARRDRDAGASRAIRAEGEADVCAVNGVEYVESRWRSTVCPSSRRPPNGPDRALVRRAVRARRAGSVGFTNWTNAHRSRPSWLDTTFWMAPHHHGTRRGVGTMTSSSRRSSSPSPRRAGGARRSPGLPGIRQRPDHRRGRRGDCRQRHHARLGRLRVRRGEPRPHQAHRGRRW